MASGKLRVATPVVRDSESTGGCDTEREPVQRILSHLGLPPDPPPLSRARDPTDEMDDEPPDPSEQLGLA